MKKWRIILIAAIVLVIGGVGYWLASPLFITQKVNESLEEIAKNGATQDSEKPTTEPTIVRSGKFVGADNFHQAAGEVKLLKAGEKYYIRFEDDFTVTNGPDLFVHFGSNGEYSAEARVAQLKGNVGSQNYEVPNDINPLNYNEVWIWCRAFSVPFGVAKIN